MRVVVTGAAGDVGSSVIEALAAREEIEEVVGLARHKPARQAGRVGGVGVAVFAASEPRTPVELCAHAFAYAQLEIAVYEQLAAAAKRSGNTKVRGLAERILAGERAAARSFAGGHQG